MDLSTQVANAYQTYLGRAASPDEIAWHVNNDGGRSVSIIANSPEAKSRASAPAAAPVDNTNQALTDFTNTAAAQRQALIDKQNTEQQGLFGQYTSAINGQEKLPALYQRLSTELGIPELGNTVQGFKNDTYRVQGLLDRLDSDVTSRTFGTLTSEGARNRIVSKEGGDLNTQLSRISNAMMPYSDLLSSAQNSLSTQMPLYMQQQDRELKPLELQINSLSDRFAREISGFNQSKQDSLTAIMDKLTRERQLSDREWQAAQDLAAEERSYQHSLSLAKASATNYLQTPATTPAPAATYNAPRALPTIAPTPAPAKAAAPAPKPVNGSMLSTVGLNGQPISLFKK